MAPEAEISSITHILKITPNPFENIIHTEKNTSI